MIFKRTPPPLSSDARSLLDAEREVPPLPAVVRARALARARAALVAGPARLPVVHATPTRARWAVAAAITLVASAAVGAAAYQIHARYAPAPAPTLAPAPIRHEVAASQPVLSPSRPLVEERVATATASEVPHLSRSDAARAELRLLRHARAAVGREDYAAALPPIAEHARRFKAGRLAEEREALRVKALTGLGRNEEARRAAAAFEAHFPKSVLLPAVSKMPVSGP
jgi:hypothetical protein